MAEGLLHSSSSPHPITGVRLAIHAVASGHGGSEDQGQPIAIARFSAQSGRGSTRSSVMLRVLRSPAAKAAGLHGATASCTPNPIGMRTMCARHNSCSSSVTTPIGCSHTRLKGCGERTAQRMTLPLSVVRRRQLGTSALDKDNKYVSFWPPHSLTFKFRPSFSPTCGRSRTPPPRPCGPLSFFPSPARDCMGAAV